MRFSRLLSVLFGVLGLVLGLTAPAAPAGAQTARTLPPAPSHRHFGVAIEPLAAYVPQTSCDPITRRGTLKLARLLVRTYPGTSFNTSYACGTDGDPSEHYDGRAIDWMVSAKQGTTRRDAKSFLKWLLASDRRGNQFAMARRLGVMYVIFDNRMWGAWDGRWQDYNNCQSKKLRKPAYDNACHRTHMHISLSWDGARAKTTFWGAAVHPTDWGPCPRKHHKYALPWKQPNYRGCRS